MARPGRIVSLISLVVLCLTAANAAANISAAEDPRTFVDALRKRGYLDTAADYLEHLSTDTSLDDSVRRLIPFEEATVLIEGAANIHDPQIRNWQLDQAQTKLRAFIAANPDLEQAQQARERLAGLLQYRADRLLEQIDKSGAVSAAARNKPATWKAKPKIYTQKPASAIVPNSTKFPKGNNQNCATSLGPLG